jgi:DNA polymerase I-like protein with 3'-5' exonuclease and polymerase domains
MPATLVGSTQSTFEGRSGLNLQRLLEKVGLSLDGFNKVYVGGDGLDGQLSGCCIGLGEEASAYLLGAPRSEVILEHRTKGRRGYVEHSERFNRWVIPTYDIDWIEKGNWAKSGVLLNDIQRAVEISEKGFKYAPPVTIEDPSVDDAWEWAKSLPDGVWLAADIETPGKADAAEDELDFSSATTIDRVSFAGRPGEGISFPWTTDFQEITRYLCSRPEPTLFWNRAFDKPRLESNGVAFKGPVYDMMFAWHVLQPDLPMAINYVGSIFLPHYPRWKYQNHSRPAYYSAVDSAALFDLATVIEAGLKETNQWDYFIRHVHSIMDCTDEMTKPGIPVDFEARKSLSLHLVEQQDKALAAIQEVVPPELKKFSPEKGYVRTPESTEGLVEIQVTAPQKICSVCGGIVASKTAHMSRKKDPCYGGTLAVEDRSVTRWAAPLPFSPSNNQMGAYLKYRGHKPVLSEPEPGKEPSPTFDKAAMGKLSRTYPDDPLYPRVKAYRDPEKLLGYTGEWNEDEQRFDGGWPTKNNRLYPVFGHRPSTGRLNCKCPNLQQIPRASKANPESLLIRGIFRPEPGTAIVEIDYSAIEAVLVGYFAGDKDFTRLARLGVHDYLNSHILRRRGIITEAADPSWSDSDLKEFFTDLKDRYPDERSQAKTVVYLSLFGGKPKKIYESAPHIFKSLKNCVDIQGAMFDLFPKIPQWQWDTTTLAADQGYLQGVWGLNRRFYKVWEWTRTREGTWLKKPGRQANEAMNFVIQHCAAGIMKEAVLNVRSERPDIFSCLRLLIHDSILGYLPLGNLEEFGSTLEQIMRRPVAVLPLDPLWDMGSHLAIGTESKVGYESWAKADKAPWN